MTKQGLGFSLILLEIIKELTFSQILSIFQMLNLQFKTVYGQSMVEKYAFCYSTLYFIIIAFKGYSVGSSSCMVNNTLQIPCCFYCSLRYKIRLFMICYSLCLSTSRIFAFQNK